MCSWACAMAFGTTRQTPQPLPPRRATSSPMACRRGVGKKMAMATETAPVLLRREGAAVWLTLNRPHVHNCLDLELLSQAQGLLAAADWRAARVLVITGAGRSFSTGGDLKAMLSSGKGAAALADYAGRLVGALNAVIARLLDCPVPVIACVNGPATGGAVGLMLAADLVAMAQDAFVQPYYGRLGFAPDGGWTALLPQRIGRARAAAWQIVNRRISAAEALATGLADATAA
ncbi:MAG: enoyl-CoA hydratase/isomerase family protein, partial [Alphaproteobacteria bacterium]